MKPTIQTKKTPEERLWAAMVHGRTGLNYRFFVGRREKVKRKLGHRDYLIQPLPVELSRALSKNSVVKSPSLTGWITYIRKDRTANAWQYTPKHYLNNTANSRESTHGLGYFLELMAARHLHEQHGITRITTILDSRKNAATSSKQSGWRTPKVNTP